MSILQRGFAAVFVACFTLIASVSVARAQTLDLRGVRWERENGEVTVLIKAGKGVTQTAIDDVVDAIGDWNVALNGSGAPTLTVLPSGKTADVVIQMKVGGGTVLGQTMPKTVSPFSCVLKSANIQLSGKAFGQPFSSAGTGNVARHELGHVFGLGHSDDPDDLMYASAESGDIFGSSKEDISPCDVDGVDAIYSAGQCSEIAPSIECGP